VVARRQTNSGDIFAQVIEDSRPSKNQSTLSMNLKVTRWSTATCRQRSAVCGGGGPHHRGQVNEPWI